MPEIDNRLMRYRHERSQIQRNRIARQCSLAFLAGVGLGALFMLLA